MTPPPTVIGIDLDNTLVCYDDLFHAAACEERLIEPSLPRSKERVRDAIRLLPDGERKWTRLQAMIYGPRLSAATMFEGSDVFLRRCARSRTRVRIVSHKTPSARLDGRSVDLRQSALAWLTAHGFFAEFGLSPRDVFFEASRADKLERIRSLRCTHFIDDLAEVFDDAAFPRETVRLLFAPHGPPSAGGGVRVFASWLDISRFFFDD